MDSCLDSRRQALRLLLGAATGTVVSFLSGCVPMMPQELATPVFTLPDRLLVRTGGVIVSVALDDYVLASSLAEVSPGGESADTISRVFQMQAVLARTYAAFERGRHGAEGFDLCDTTHCQLYDPARIRTSRFAQAAQAAVVRTSGAILMYGGRPAETLFHADCGGCTAAADAVWGGAAVPYLASEPDLVPALTHHAWRVRLTPAELRTALNADARTRVGGRLDAVTVQGRDASGRATTIALFGETSPTVHGEDFRAALNRTLGDRAIQSTRFTIGRDGAGFQFDGSGFGHGVGLCQAGAAARARRGETLDDVFGHYFPGARLTDAR